MTDTNVEDSEVHDLWDELQKTIDPDGREFLLERLAELALDGHDFSDCDLSEETHEHFELLRRAHENYHLTAVKVGRFVARMIDNHEALSKLQELADNSSAN
jgi:hypothetical protein